MERVDNIHIRLRRIIANGEYDNSSRIPPERVLASELGVGRRSLRRALDVLEKQGRVARYQGRGTFLQHDPSSNRRASRPPASLKASEVSLFSGQRPDIGQVIGHTNPLEVMEVRLAIEPVMARLASLRASRTEIILLHEVANQTRVAADPVLYQKADALFYRLIAEAARNTMVFAILDMLQACQHDAGWRRLGKNAHCYKRQSVHANFHREIASAIAARSGERAQNVMHQHLNDVQRHIYQHAFPAGMAAQ